MTNYEQIAREAGYCLEYSLWFPGLIVWMNFNKGTWSDTGFANPAIAWECCCRDNNLIAEET